MSKFSKVVITILALCCVGLGIKYWYHVNNLQNSINDLHNKIAEKDSTIEVQENLYRKSSLVIDDLKNMIDKKDKEMKKLLNEIKKKNESIFSLSKVAAKWKKDYEALVDAQQSEVPSDDGKSTRTKVSFNKDFGYITVSGFTLTNPPQAKLLVHQNRPLILTLTLTQDKNGMWYHYVTSSEDNVGIDILLSGVNPYLFKEKWYEKIGVTSSLGLSDSGVLLSSGLSYKFSKFNIGPSVWFEHDGQKLNKYFGFSVTWNPFSR